MQQQLWASAVAAILLAVLSGLAEHRRRKRRWLDRVGFMPWALIQVLSMLSAAVLVSLALHLR